MADDTLASVIPLRRKTLARCWAVLTDHFPVAIIVARPVMPDSVNVNHRLLLKNVSDGPVLITWEHGDRTQLRVAKDDSIHGIVRSQRRGEIRSQPKVRRDHEAEFNWVIRRSHYILFHPTRGVES